MEMQPHRSISQGRFPNTPTRPRIHCLGSCGKKDIVVCRQRHAWRRRSIMRWVERASLAHAMTIFGPCQYAIWDMEDPAITLTAPMYVVVVGSSSCMQLACHKLACSQAFPFHTTIQLKGSRGFGGVNMSPRLPGSRRHQWHWRGRWVARPPQGCREHPGL